MHCVCDHFVFWTRRIIPFIVFIHYILLCRKWASSPVLTHSHQHSASKRCARHGSRSAAIKLVTWWNGLRFRKWKIILIELKKHNNRRSRWLSAASSEKKDVYKMSAHSSTAYLFQSKQKTRNERENPDEYRRKNKHFISVFIYGLAIQHLMAIGNIS